MPTRRIGASEVRREQPPRGAGRRAEAVKPRKRGGPDSRRYQASRAGGQGPLNIRERQGCGVSRERGGTTLAPSRITLPWRSRQRTAMALVRPWAYCEAMPRQAEWKDPRGLCRDRQLLWHRDLGCALHRAYRSRLPLFGDSSGLLRCGVGHGQGAGASRAAQTKTASHTETKTSPGGGGNRTAVDPGPAPTRCAL